ncbi:MAG: hypothetical protein ACYTET_04675 [Planctomycetota bacterium]|jgi:hypothetical protein
MRVKAWIVYGVTAACLMLQAGCLEGTKAPKSVSGTSIVNLKSQAGTKLSVDPVTGTYTVMTAQSEWVFSGSLETTLSQVWVRENFDKIGRYKEVGFRWEQQGPRKGAIRLYGSEPIVLFDVTYPQRVTKPNDVFPNFTTFPKRLHAMSYKTTAFAERTWSLQQNGSPWVFFNDAADTFILSAASNFMIAQMKGDGTQSIGCGLNDELSHVPAGFSHQTILAMGHGINTTWHRWGGALMCKGSKKRPLRQSSDELKYLGYWTGEGSHYNYNFDPEKGYEKTLLAVKDHYDKKVVPFEYMQIGGWFYPKGVHDAAGELDLDLQGGGVTTEDAAASWQNSGGMMDYVADEAIFPLGTLEFRRFIGGGLMTNNRWLDVKSPYRDTYSVSGIAPIDEKFWSVIAPKLAVKGVDCYQQDWLDVIDDHSPKLRRTPDHGREFMDNMAQALIDQDITMQYRRAYPKHFMQGSQYPNLVTIGTSPGVFGRRQYDRHLYSTRLADALGIWPWGGVCSTHNTQDMLMMVLSAGVVGVGEEMGAEHASNIRRCVRADSVIVKPDAPLVPMDQSWIADAKGAGGPMIAATYTDHAVGKVHYVFAYSRDDSSKSSVQFTAAELGITEPVYVFDYYAGVGGILQPGSVYSATLNASKDGTGYYILSPISESGIAVLGDPGKYVTCGESRIEEVSQYEDKVVVNIVAGKGERYLNLIGYADHWPAVKAYNGAAEVDTYDAASGLFRCAIEVTAESKRTMRQGQDIARVVVTLE